MSNLTITGAQLVQIMPFAKQRAGAFVAPLNAAMGEFGINTTPARAAAFLAQIAHESGELHYLTEIASGAAYEGRRDLGNVEPGDGPRFKGRGLIQITGRANYAAAGQALGRDLITNPVQAAEPDLACRIAGWFWDSRHLNELADMGEFERITRRINGGTNGLAQRQAYHERAKAVLA